MAILGTYALGNQSKEYQLRDDYVDFVLADERTLGDIVWGERVSRDRPYEVEMIQDDEKVKLVILQPISPDCFPIDFLDTEAVDKYLSYCIVKKPGNNEEFIIPYE